MKPEFWFVTTDLFPRSLYVIRHSITGDCLRSEKRPGWYRTTSEAKAQRDCDRLNAAIAKATE